MVMDLQINYGLRKMNRLLDNKEELVTGFVFTLLFALPYKEIVVITTLCFSGAILWRLGGEYNKLYRRLGVPLLVGGLLTLLYSNILLLLVVPGAFGVLCIGYGIPSVNDSGSFLGKLVYGWVKQKEALATVFTRYILGLLMMVAMLPLAFVNLPHYLFVLIAWPILYALMDLLVVD